MKDEMSSMTEHGTKKKTKFPTSPKYRPGTDEELL